MNRVGATISGGGATSRTVPDSLSVDYYTVTEPNTIAYRSDYATIGGGSGNTITNLGYYSVIGGGHTNFVGFGSSKCVVGGGIANRISFASSSVIAGGSSNLVDGNYCGWATIGGGDRNRVTTNWATVPGGRLNVAAGEYSFAAGLRAQANHRGSFVWADALAWDGDNFASTAPNQFNVRASGGYRLFSATGFNFGVTLAPGSGSWTSMSDRDAKENYAEVSSREILEKVAALPVQT